MKKHKLFKKEIARKEFLGAKPLRDVLYAWHDRMADNFFAGAPAGYKLEHSIHDCYLMVKE